MADGIISNVADQIVGWLASQAANEIGSILGVKGELEDLNDSLSRIKAVLGDAEKKRIGSQRVKLWLERLEDVIDEADDLKDELSSEELRRKVMFGDYSKMINKVRTFFSSSNQVAFRLKMAHRIKDLRKKLDKIDNEAKHFHFDALPQEKPNAVSIERDTHSFVHEEDVTGRDDDKRAILRMLMDNENGIEAKLSVIPIVGAGGVGKTALVQLVFNDNQVQDYFDLKMWVCVSGDFNVKLLVQRIIKSATSNSKSPENLEIEQLRRDLHKEISGKRYLLVLDDVWNEEYEKWKSLQDLLEIGANGSKLILTTRSEMVAKITGTVEPYRLGVLDDDKSWSLFKKMAFQKGEEPENGNIVEIGKKIVKKCGGVPLAIKAIGQMLYLKKSETEWLSLVEKELHKISQNKDEDVVFLTLQLSYDHLPLCLKQCFCYCCLFPKDYKIDVKHLIRLWMAQGFIKSADPIKCLEEVGNDYFMELLCRSFFQEVEKDMYGDLVSCKMHDLMHDLATLLAGKKCVKLDLDKGNTVDNETRHLSFDCHLYAPNQVPTTRIQAKKIRSIFLSHETHLNSKKGLEESFCKEVISTFKFLRFLDLHKLYITTVPSCIGELKYLRYLDLSDNYNMMALPSSITRLIHLQTLKLNYCDSLQKLPRDIKRLVNLRHLEINGCNKLTYMPSGLGQLTNLQTLSNFVLKSNNRLFPQPTTAELGELAALNLRGELTILNVRHGMDSKDANFKDKIHIRSVNLVWDTHAVEDASKVVEHEITLEGFRQLKNLKKLSLHHYRGVSLPSWLLSAFSNLVKFELRNCTNCQYLPPLNQLCSLKELILGDMPNLEYVMDNGDSSVTLVMASLKRLWLVNVHNLKSWWRDDESAARSTLWPSAFPCLSEVQITDCPKLNCMPLYPNVDTLQLRNTSVKPLEETIMRSTTSASASASTSSTLILLSPLPYITILTLSNVKNLQSVDYVESLTSLKELRLEYCHELEYLSPSIFQCLSSLQRLTISVCEELDISNIDDSSWRGLRSLQHLSLGGVPKLAALPEGLQHVTTLRSLGLVRCLKLRAIPEWIGNFSSLQDLDIWACPGLTSLPEAIRSMTCLNTLQIRYCPVLIQRCRKEIGEDWPKISHIPVVFMI